jgi:hypothetical protein
MAENNILGLIMRSSPDENGFGCDGYYKDNLSGKSNSRTAYYGGARHRQNCLYFPGKRTTLINSLIAIFFDFTGLPASFSMQAAVGGDLNNFRKSSFTHRF